MNKQDINMAFVAQMIDSAEKANSEILVAFGLAADGNFLFWSPEHVDLNLAQKAAELFLKAVKEVNTIKNATTTTDPGSN